MMIQSISVHKQIRNLERMRFLNKNLTSMIPCGSQNHQILFLYSSTSAPLNDKSDTVRIPSLSPNCLNLIQRISSKTLKSMCALPEAQSAINHLSSIKTNTKDIIDPLLRANQIFQSVPSLRDEYQSTNLILSQSYNDQCQYDHSIKHIDQVLQLYTHDNSTSGLSSDDKNSDYLNQLLMVKAKILYNKGNFLESLETLNEAEKTTRSKNPYKSYHQNEGWDGEYWQSLLSSLCVQNSYQLLSLGLSPFYESDVLSFRNDKMKSTDFQQPSSDTIIDYFKQDDLDTIQKMFFTAIESQSRNQNGVYVDYIPLAIAAFLSNKGVCEAMRYVTKDIHSTRNSSLKPFHIDEIESWKKGLKVLDDWESRKFMSQNTDVSDGNINKNEEQLSSQNLYYKFLSQSIRARIYCNMAWFILFNSSISYGRNQTNTSSTSETKQKVTSEADLKLGSEFSAKALEIYDQLSQYASSDDITDRLNHGVVMNFLKPATGRALFIVASCYAKAGSAITAEGLFQSSIDDIFHGQNMNDITNMKNMNDTYIWKQKLDKLHHDQKLDARSAYLYYSKLCSNWEKRISDTKKNKDGALMIDSLMDEGWQSKSSLYSGAWFFTPNDFLISQSE